MEKCKNCKKRHVGCHDTCKDYREYSEAREAIRKERQRQKASKPPSYEKRLMK